MEKTFEEFLYSIADSIDSLIYISILVEIEERVGLDFPDEALSENLFLKPAILLEIVEDMLLTKTGEEN